MQSLGREGPQGEMFGEERLANLLCSNRDHPAQHIARVDAQSAPRGEVGEARGAFGEELQQN